MKYKDKKIEFIGSLRNDYLRCIKVIESCKTIEQVENVYKWLERIKHDRWEFYAERIVPESSFSPRFRYITDLFKLYDEVNVIYRELKEKYFQQINKILGI